MRAHFNGKLVFKLLVDIGLVVNVMPLRMLKALGRSIDNLIETKVFVLAFIGESQRLWAYSLLTSLWVVRAPY